MFLQNKEATTYPIYLKKGEYGDDLKEKILYANNFFYTEGFTDKQRLWMLAMIDHESAGTWSPTVVGDNGCSIGISQYNTCAGNFPADTYEGQVAQFADRMKYYFENFSFESAVGKHNMPAWQNNPKYLGKVQRSVDTFYEVASN